MADRAAEMFGQLGNDINEARKQAQRLQEQLENAPSSATEAELAWLRDLRDHQMRLADQMIAILHAQAQVATFYATRENLDDISQKLGRAVRMMEQR